MPIMYMNATHMQFLAAKSLCTNLFSTRYSIPLAIWRHIESSFVVESVTFIEKKNNQLIPLMPVIADKINKQSQTDVCIKFIVRSLHLALSVQL